MKKTTKIADSISLAVIGLGFVVSFIFFAYFPPLVPIHWNAAGIADRYASKVFGAFFFPLLIAGLYLLMTLVPMIDPKKYRYEEFSGTYSYFKTAITGILFVIYLMTSFAGLGYPVPVSTLVPMVIGVLILILGFQLGKVKMNWFLGIRTPWTLSDDQVWDKTHKLGSKVFIIGGIALIVSSLLPIPYNIYGFISSFVFVGIVPVIYSYFVYKKLHPRS